MDFALLALAVAAGAFILTVVVPIATFLRVRKAADDIRRINGRLDGLETELTRFHVAATESGSPGGIRTGRRRIRRSACSARSAGKTSRVTGRDSARTATRPVGRAR